MTKVIAQPGPVVSNRASGPPFIGGAPRGPAGVDFLAISFPIVSYNDDMNMWDEVSVKPFKRSVDMVVDEVPVRISFLEMPSVKGTKTPICARTRPLVASFLL